MNNDKIYDVMWESLHHNIKCVTLDGKTHFGYVSNVESRADSSSGDGEIFLDIDDGGLCIKESNIKNITFLDTVDEVPFLDIKHVRENAMDLLIMEEFVCNKQFRTPFFRESPKLSAFCQEGYAVEKVFHSLSNYDGESDIIFVLNANGIRFSIFIEDKINAITMEDQSNRYEKRALDANMQGILGHTGNNFEIFLVAPQEYIRKHKEDPNASYEHCVSYETLQKCLLQQNDIRSLFKYSVIQSAITKEADQSITINDNVTDFWKQLDSVCSKYDLEIINPYQDRGADSVWIRFKTKLKKVQLVYKARQGYVDLQFKDYSDKLEQLREKIGSKLEDNMHLIAVSKTAKSAAVRIANDNWKIDLRNPFSMYIDIITEVLHNAKKLEQIANSLSYYDLYE